MSEISNERLNRFVELLKGIFELDKSDLDFGIYRIMNIRKDEIEKFLNEGLPQKVTETLKPFATAGKEDLLKKKEAIEKQASDLGIEISNSPKLAEEYAEVNKALAGGTDLAALETDVYSSLYSFFSRYYDEGDFISKRRYKEGVYAIPYEGEEVKLYWANQDQYYIKTSENFKDYVFTAQDWTVHFNLVDATTEQNNNKEKKDEKRFFMLFEEDNEKYPGVKTFECDTEKKELIIRFVFDISSKYTGKNAADQWENENYGKICEFILKEHNELMMVLLTDLPGEKKNQMKLIQKHLKGYVAKNSFDYFIHKDLEGFLSRELDFFIKNEVMHLDDLDTSNEARVSSYLAKVRAIKKVGKILIEFLAQIENFQKKLWLKKKFVVETNWCITLDKIDESFYEEICNNNDQVKEWIEMYAIDEIVNDVEHQEPFTNPPSVEFLKQNRNLIVDTKNFSDTFKEKLVASIDDLDESSNGVMFNGDNYHVLKLLKERYKTRIDCLYFDPPYNTGPSEILYKNNYKDSSWLTLMHDRVSEALVMMSDECSMCVAIDDYAMVKMSEMLDEQMYGFERNMVIVNHHPQGTPKDNISRTHEYAVIFTPEGDAVIGLDADMTEYETRALMRSGTADNNHRYGRPNSFYAILVDMKSLRVMGMERPPALNEPYPRENTAEGWRRIYPVSKDGTERVWRISYNSKSFQTKDLNDLIECSSAGTLYQKVFSKKTPIISNWIDKKYNAGTYGTTVIKNMLGDSNAFSYPKSLYTVQDFINAATNAEDELIVMDFFAGSGTTAHAIMDLNDQDCGKRSYILVEMGEYFDSATLPRVKKAAYAVDIDAWKDGKPLNRNTGVSQIIKYMRLESYEDALSNIELQKPQTEVTSLFGDEYLINYMLDIEAKGSLLNVQAFKDPFAYFMKITEKNESKSRKVDVVETFNYLIGLTVVRQGATKYFSAEPAKSPEYEGAVDLKNDSGAVDLKNDSNGKFAFRQIEGTLPDGRRALVIWRNVNDDSLRCNAALDAYFSKYRLNPQDREYDVIYVNGDNNLENLRTDSESWKVQMIETEFNARMFEEN